MIPNSEMIRHVNDLTEKSNEIRQMKQDKEKSKKHFQNRMNSIEQSTKRHSLLAYVSKLKDEIHLHTQSKQKSE